MSNTPTYTFIPGAVVNSYLSLVRYLRDKRGIGLQSLKKAFEALNPYFLVSFGDLYDVPNGKKKKELLSVSEMVNKCLNEINKFKDITDCGGKLFLDSGGFQISMGRVPETILPHFIDTYHTLVPKIEQELGEQFHSFFFLDAIPGEKGNLKSPDIVSHWCFESLKSLKEHGLHKDPVLWNKFMFVVHVGSVIRFSMWNSFMDFMVDELGTLPVKYSVGGLVAGGHRYKQSHVLHWVYGLLYILWWLYIRNSTEKGKKITFHVLGLVELVYVISIYIVGEYLYQKYNLGIDFTYDGTAFLRKSLMGRLIGYINKETLVYDNLCFATKEMKQSTPCGTMNVEQYVLSLFYEIWEKIGYEPSHPVTSLYKYHMGPFEDDINMWLTFIETHVQNTIKEVYLEKSREIVSDILSNSSWNSLYEFIDRVFSTQSISNKKVMFKQIKNSLLKIDELFEKGKHFSFDDSVFLPSLAVTEVY